MPDQGGAHIGAIATIKQPQRHEFDECVKTGSDWVHLPGMRPNPLLRQLPVSTHKQARARRPGIRSPYRRSRESWLYCYPDEAAAEY